MPKQFEKLDHAVYRVERLIVVASLVVMSVVVFLDVVHRTFASPTSKFAEVVAKIAGLFGSPIEPDTAAHQQLSEIAPYAVFVSAFALAYFGVRSARRTTPMPRAKAALYALGGLVATWGLLRLMLWALPNGLVWSQNLGLVLTLWVGFVGASMCTYENKHLKVEAVQRYLPRRYLPAVQCVSAIATTVICLGLLWVSIRYVLWNHDEFVATEGKGGLVSGVDLPKYLAFAALPIAFGLMSVRFAAKAVAAAQGHIEELDPTGLGGAPIAAAEDLPPSEVETEAVRASRTADRGRPSEIDTATSGPVDADAPRPQSKVGTDPHKRARAAAEEDSGR